MEIKMNPSLNLFGKNVVINNKNTVVSLVTIHFNSGSQK
jgi:hypothetical protein